MALAGGEPSIHHWILATGWTTPVIHP